MDSGGCGRIQLIEGRDAMKKRCDMLNKEMRRADGDNKNPIYKAVRNETTPPDIRRYRAKLFQVCLFILVAAFGILAFLVRRSAFFPIDLKITRFLQSQDSMMSVIMNLISWAGYTPQSFILTGLTALVICFLGLRWEATVIVFGDIFEELLNLVVKALIHRPRPSADLVHVFKQYSSYSFPSGHVMFYTVFFGFLWFLAFTFVKCTWKRTLLLASLSCPVLLIGISRVYLGEHWASDAVGAYLLGSLALIGVIAFYRWGKARFFVQQPVAKGKRE